MRNSCRGVLHRELVDLPARRHREQIRAFEEVVVGVVKFLVDSGLGDLTFDLDVDRMVRDLQRRELVMDCE